MTDTARSRLEQSRHQLRLHLDLASGVAGDMLLASLLDIGVPREVVAGALGALGLGPEVLSLSETRRGGLRASLVDVAEAEESAVGRLHGYAEAEKLIGGSSLDEGIKESSVSVMRRLAEAESKVHGVSWREVHFHEVGGVDTVVDVVGVSAALDWLGPESVTASPVAVGGGRVATAHGRLPVPAPATLELLEGVPVFGEPGPRRELATPTGAALIREHVERFGNLPPMVVGGVGYGAGHAELEGQPNVVRAVWGSEGGGEERQESFWHGAGRGQRLVELRCNLDDMSPELMARAAEKTLAEGARDAWVEPVVMKKGRPGWILGALADPADMDGILETLFAETTTLGVRYQRVERIALERRSGEVDTQWGKVAVKEALRDGRVVRVTPEYESCRRVAERHSVPLREVYEEVRRLISRQSG